MLNGISTMNSYYSMYRYGFSYGNAPARSLSGTSAQDRNLPAAGSTEASGSAKHTSRPATDGAAQNAPAAAPGTVGSQPAVFSGGRLYLASPAEGSQTDKDPSGSGFMQMSASPEELAVRMRIQYLDPSSSENLKGLSGLSDQKENISENEAVGKLEGSEECQTCKQRKYQDGSDDMGVSFQTPTHVAPEAAASAVRGHEQEHVVREQAKAEREDRRVVSQDVTLHTGICPECGEVYISGGTTRTVTAAEPKTQETALDGRSGQNQTERKPFLAVA